jgi:hypothetical protein
MVAANSDIGMSVQVSVVASPLLDAMEKGIMMAVFSSGA